MWLCGLHPNLIFAIDFNSSFFFCFVNFFVSYVFFFTFPVFAVLFVVFFIVVFTVFFAVIFAVFFIVDFAAIFAVLFRFLQQRASSLLIRNSHSWHSPSWELGLREMLRWAISSLWWLVIDRVSFKYVRVE